MRTTPVLVAAAMAALAWMTVPVRGQEGARAGNQTVKPSTTFERLADGQPNVQGMWAAVNGSTVSLTNPISQSWPTKPEHIDTQHRCLLSGVPRLYFIIPSFKIYEATIDDPAVFTRPWTMRVAERRRPDEELWESACYEGAVNPDEFLIKNGPAQK